MLETLFGEEKEREEIKNIYNRYAHITMYLVKDDTSLELIGPDHYKIYLNYKQLKDLNVTYIVSSRDLTEFSDDTIEISQKYLDSGMGIYEVSYK